MRKNAEFHLKRVDPQSGWADDELRDAFRYSIGDPSPLSRGKIAGIAVSVVIGLPLLVFIILCAIFRSLPRFQWPPWELGPAAVDVNPPVGDWGDHQPFPPPQGPEPAEAGLP